MTQETPIQDPEDYKPHTASEENGLLEEFENDQNPEYLMEDSSSETTFQVDFGYFTHQTEIYDWS